MRTARLIGPACWIPVLLGIVMVATGLSAVELPPEAGSSDEVAPADTYSDIAVTRLSERIIQLRVRAPGIFGTNVVVVATQKGLVVIDTWCGPFIFGRIAEIVQQQLGRRDFAYVLNSHEDVDHATGGGAFGDAVLVGHDNLFKALKAAHAGRVAWQASYRGRIQGYIKGEEEKLARLAPASEEAKALLQGIENLKKLDGDFARGFPILPENPRGIISFSDSLRITLGDVTIEGYTAEGGHTPSDILIYIPEEGFLFTGDVAQVSIQSKVRMEAWLAQLDRFSSPGANVKTVLTGHSGRVFTRQELAVLRDYLRALWDGVREAHRRGLSLEQIQERYSLENEMARFRLLAGEAFNAGTLDQLRDKHRRNIEKIFSQEQTM